MFNVPFSLSQFVQLRPYAFHLTFRDNLGRIRAHRRLESAANLVQEATGSVDLSERRSKHLALFVGSDTVWLRDQLRLHVANMVLEEEWQLSDFILDLN